MVEPFIAALAPAVGALRETVDGLGALADGIEAAQSEYRQRMLAVGFTAGVGVLLTPLTFGGSDEGAAIAVTAELAAATELASGAAQTVLALLAGVADQAVALATRWAVLSGVAVAGDAGAAAVVHGPGAALHYVHLGDDLELALVGAVAVPVAAELAAALRRGGPGRPGSARARRTARRRRRLPGLGRRAGAGGPAPTDRPGRAGDDGTAARWRSRPGRSRTDHPVGLRRRRGVRGVRP